MASSAAASDNSYRRSLRPIISDSFDLLRSNLKMTLCLFFLSLIPSSVSRFTSYIFISPIILQVSAFPFPIFTSSSYYFSVGTTVLPHTAESISAAFLCFFLFFVPLTPILYILYYRMATDSTSEPLLRTSAGKIFVTRLCIVVLDLAFKFLLLLLRGRVVHYLSSHSSFFSFLFLGNAVAIVIFFGEFLRTLWVLSLVAAVAENLCGVAAMRRAIELVAQSFPERWRQIVGLPVILYLATEAVFYPFYRGGEAAWTVIAVVMVAGVAAVTLLNLAMHVAFYCELKAEEGDNKILLLF